MDGKWDTQIQDYSSLAQVRQRGQKEKEIQTLRSKQAASTAVRIFYVSRELCVLVFLILHMVYWIYYTAQWKEKTWLWGISFEILCWREENKMAQLSGGVAIKEGFRVLSMYHMFACCLEYSNGKQETGNSRARRSHKHSPPKVTGKGPRAPVKELAFGRRSGLSCLLDPWEHKNRHTVLGTDSWVKKRSFIRSLSCLPFSIVPINLLSVSNE